MCACVSRMYLTATLRRRTDARRSSTSSPGSTTTPSSVSGQARTKPFLPKGGTALTSRITGEPPDSAFPHYGAGGPMDPSHEVRVQTSLLAALEKRCLVWIAGRLSSWVTSDQLTALGSAAMFGAGVCYSIGAVHRPALFGAIGLLAVNWFGDSLDGTVARVRHQERPRYGFYVDHVLDALGVLFLVAGLVLGGFMSLAVGAGFLIAYYLLANEIALATHTVGVFRISYW